ncbi:hypothetical protein MGG_08037 [Pyricularia oryzae 70-15]|uniref:Uncharacterized protein n=1 Tax=Pyricularia oryzae (strain 70-15 / ATCC MYA-4617 / FGSC 8958) TaxID=242507 RepID=G4MXP6_PYRO7|nr:uncharacterized protein MGG_08037 [Pyricularia oryzae 70-15]EHA55183.1 hypothetical protein MGG_08037 [Pyricularia oryzae 70-15]
MYICGRKPLRKPPPPPPTSPTTTTPTPAQHAGLPLVQRVTRLGTGRPLPERVRRPEDAAAADTGSSSYSTWRDSPLTCHLGGIRWPPPQRAAARAAAATTTTAAANNNNSKQQQQQTTTTANNNNSKQQQQQTTTTANNNSSSSKIRHKASGHVAKNNNNAQQHIRAKALKKTNAVAATTTTPDPPVEQTGRPLAERVTRPETSRLLSETVTRTPTIWKIINNKSQMSMKKYRLIRKLANVAKVPVLVLMLYPSTLLDQGTYLPPNAYI